MLISLTTTTMEEGRSVLFDASAYMLFEATGDSETSYDFDHDSDAAEDDAQSCSCASTDRRMHDVVDAAGDDIRGLESDYCSGDDEEDTGDEDEGVVDQCRRKTAAEATKSEVFEESNVMMSGREGDKLFWEACLAS